ncbi:MAG: hypothetical protein ABSC92_13585 [Rhizomicrobium sp.]|jgi:hypothetical protein
MDMYRDMDEAEASPPKHSLLLCVWGLCAAVLLGPSVLVWFVRGTAWAMGCAPGPGLCRGMELGGGLRDTLDLAWFIGQAALFSLAISFAAAVIALLLRRPLLAALSPLVLPLAALAFPALAVFASTYSGCQVNEDGIGDCSLWGNHMGMTFHNAAQASATLYDIVPYSFALALMIGFIGFLFFRPHSNALR